jgi:hypothetical protein
MAYGSDKRKYKRMACEGPLSFSLSVVDFKSLKKINSRGTCLDISDYGIGFLTDYPLEPGHILKIQLELPSVDAGMVKWSDKVNGNYRVGVFLYK